jgi:hypothetical protein
MRCKKSSLYVLDANQKQLLIHIEMRSQIKLACIKQQFQLTKYSDHTQSRHNSGRGAPRCSFTVDNLKAAYSDTEANF